MIKQPFTEQEKIVMDHLIAAVNAFKQLQITHGCHHKDFIDGVHKCQDVLIHRVLQRDYPKTFPTYEVRNG